MSWLDEVPIKILLGSHGESKKEVELVTAPEIIVPDYLKILQETEYAFSLENWVLNGMQGGYGVPSAHHPSVTSRAATCPPYRMLFGSPQQSRLAGRWSSDFWEPNPLRRSRSLNAAHLHVMNDTVKFKISDSDEDESPDNEVASFMRPKCNSSGLKRQALDVKDLLSLPSELNSSILQGSFPSLKARGGKLWKIQDDGDSFNELSSPSLNSSVPQAPTRPLGSHATVHDLSVELLSALSPEERELLQAVTQHGYSLRTAIVALQKTGHRSPEQILRYLVACDRLCELGYDKTQVEEALEMFQNCEKKAEEFLHLLTQFHEMGFQQNAIKEVLLMHGNHRDDALEELMMQVV